MLFFFFNQIYYLSKKKKKSSYKEMWHNMIEFLKIWIHLLLNHVVSHHFVRVFFFFFCKIFCKPSIAHN
jgi:hypothetical protein